MYNCYFFQNARKMSTQSATRKRVQKHTNATRWEAHKHRSDTVTKKIEQVLVTNCCERCTGVIQWKIE